MKEPHRAAAIAGTDRPGWTAPSVFRLTGYCADHGGRTRVVNLGSWPCGPYAASVERLLDDEAFRQELERRVALKGLSLGRRAAVYVRVGKGPPTPIALQGCRGEPDDRHG